MKKRLISMILAVCLIAGLFGAMPAFAEEKGIVTYTLQQGDTVANVCARLGIDFHANQKIIAKLNNITDYTKLPVGKVLRLPTKEYVASAANTGSTATGTTTAVAGTTVVSNGNLQTGDYVAYYLLPYTMQAGDTVSAVCNALGVNFSANSAVIKSFNNITNYNTIRVGKTIYLPSNTVPAGVTNATAIVGHRILSGETTQSICESYGVKYSNVANTLQSLNPQTNLNRIYAGNILFLPVSAAAVTATATTTTTTTTTAATVTTGLAHKITADNSSNGSFTFYANGVKVDTAVAGTVIEIRCISSGGYEAGEMEVMGSDGMSVKVTDSKFTMPDCDAKVSVNFVSNKYYSVVKTFITGTSTLSDKDGNKLKHGNYDIYVDGKTYIDGYANVRGGSKIYIIPKPDSGYEMKAVYYTDDGGNTWKKVPSNQGFFYMPSCDVFVTVEFTQAVSRDIIIDKILDEDDNAISGLSATDFVTKIGQKTSELAYTGETVTVDFADPSYSKLYKIVDLQIINAEDNKYLGTAGGASFDMPAYNIKINVVLSENPVSLSVSSTSNGKAWFEYLGSSRSEVTKGKTVTAYVEPALGYEVSSISLKGNGTTYTISDFSTDSNGRYYFNVKADTDMVLTVKFAKMTQTLYYKIQGDTAFGTAWIVNDKEQALTFSGAWQSTQDVTPGELYRVNFTTAYGKVAKVKWVGTNDSVAPETITSAVLANGTYSWRENFIEPDNKATYNFGGTKYVYIVVEFLGAEHNLYTNCTNCMGVVFCNKPYGDKDRQIITTARAGDTVYVDVSTLDYYTIKPNTATYININGKAEYVTMTNVSENYYTGSFTMPDRDTTYSLNAAKFRYPLVKDLTSTANFDLSINELNVTEGTWDDTVTIKPTGASATQKLKATVWYTDVNGVDQYIAVNASGQNFTFQIPKLRKDGTHINIKLDKDGDKEYTVYCNPYSNGTVDFYKGSTTYTVTKAQPGEVITIKTHPNTNYQVVGLSVTNAANGNVTWKQNPLDANEFTFVMPSTDAWVTVTFDGVLSPVKLESNGAGLGIYNTDQQGTGITAGSNIYGSRKIGETVWVYTNAPYYNGQNIYNQMYPCVYDDVTKDTVGFNPTTYSFNGGTYWCFSFQMPAHQANVVINASGTPFTPPVTQKFNVIVNSAANGKVDASASLVAVGDTVTLTVTPDAGYDISAIGGATLIPAVTAGTYTYTFTMPSSNVTLTPTFTTKTYKITGGTMIKGSVTAGPSNPAPYNSTVTLTHTPNTGYEIDKVEVTGDVSGTKYPVASDMNSFVMPAEDVTVSAVYKIKSSAVTIKSGITGGTVTLDKSSGVYDYLDTVYVTHKPDKGMTFDVSQTKVMEDRDGDNIYEFDVTSLCSKTDGSDTTDTNFTVGEYPVEVTVGFKKIDYKIYAGTMTGGTVTALKNPANYGDKVGLSFTYGSGTTLYSVDIVRASDNKIIATYIDSTGAFTSTDPDITTFDSTEFVMPAYEIKLNVTIK